MITRAKRLALFVGLLLLGGAASSSAAWPWENSPENTMTVRYRLAVAANVSTAAVVVDLSDTTNWPHKNTGELNISSIRWDLDKVAASTTTLKLGVVNFVNSSTGSVSWFTGKERGLNVSNTDTETFYNYSPNFVRLKVTKGSLPDTDGTPTYLITSDKTSGSTTYQNDVNLPSPNTATKPGVGDLILSVENGAGAVVVNLTVQYHADNR